MKYEKINILKDDVVGKISAGEVVERPASAVKELIENSIDAGADSIEIEVQSAGQTLIRVADNGDGMTMANAKLACKQHATSKLKDASDLDRIDTFGFRGEALSSIAAVSQMDLTTSNKNDDTGVYIYLEGGEAKKIRPAGRSKGTTIEIRNLFYNVPARRKFLKKESTELAEIVNVTGRFAVSYPGVEFRLTHGDRQLLHVTHDMDVLERIRLVLGEDISENLVEIGSKDGGIEVNGYVSRPSITRKDKRGQLFFVNNRYVQSRLLSDALMDAYSSMLERGRHPSAVVFLNVPPGAVDVNVHPTKLVVKFDNEKAIRGFLAEAITNRFSELKTGIEDTTGQIASAPIQVTVPSEELVTTPKSPPDKGDRVDQREFKYRSTSPIKDVPISEKAEIRSGVMPEKTTNDKREDIFQVGGCYIVRIKDDGLTITDQHAAHERILYDLFSQATEDSPAESQNLLFPKRIELSAAESIIMEKVRQKFRVLGFDIELFGDRSYLVQAAPAILKDSDIKKVMLDILGELSSKDVKKKILTDEHVKIATCRAAVKAGDKLNKKEMLALLEQLHKSEIPFTCPHGRPTVLNFTVPELEKMFRRK